MSDNNVYLLCIVCCIVYLRWSPLLHPDSLQPLLEGSPRYPLPPLPPAYRTRTSNAKILYSYSARLYRHGPLGEIFRVNLTYQFACRATRAEKTTVNFCALPFLGDSVVLLSTHRLTALTVNFPCSLDPSLHSPSQLNFTFNASHVVCCDLFPQTESLPCFLAEKATNAC